jgi:hypothetical protein
MTDAQQELLEKARSFALLSEGADGCSYEDSQETNTMQNSGKVSL